MTKPELILWDNDGTLVESEQAHYISISKVAAANYEVDISNINWWDHCSGKGHAKIWKWLEDKSPGFQMDQQEFIEACLDDYQTNISQLQARKGVKESLMKFNEAGIPSVVLSSTMGETVRRGLEETGILSLVKAVYGPDDLDRLGVKRKPSPEAPMEIAQKHGVEDLSKVLYFEDSETGCECGHNAGILVVQFIHHAGFGDEQPHEKSQYAGHHINSEEELEEFTTLATSGFVLN